MFKHINNNKRPSCCATAECLELLQMLSDKTRQEIIIFLSNQKEICVNDIAKHFSQSRPTISHHLILMKKAGVLNSAKKGKETYYSFNKDHVIGLLSALVNALKTCC